MRLFIALDFVDVSSSLRESLEKKKKKKEPTSMNPLRDVYSTDLRTCTFATTLSATSEHDNHHRSLSLALFHSFVEIMLAMRYGHQPVAQCNYFNLMFVY